MGFEPSPSVVGTIYVVYLLRSILAGSFEHLARAFAGIDNMELQAQA